MDQSAGAFGNNPRPTASILSPGGSATFKVHWEDVPVGNETSCPTASYLAVTPTSRSDPLTVPVTITACGGGHLDLSVVVPANDLSRNWSGYAATSGVFTGVTAT